MPETNVCPRTNVYPHATRSYGGYLEEHTDVFTRAYLCSLLAIGGATEGGYLSEEACDILLITATAPIAFCE